MKTTAFFTILVAYAAGAAVKEKEELQTEDKMDFECVTDGFFPYPEDCTKFIQCADKTAIAYSCDPDLHFSEASGMCDWPQIANCEWADESELKKVKMLKPRGQDCIRPAHPDEFTCDKNGAYPHPEICDHYYDCRNGKPILCRCTEGYFFDLSYSGCNYPELVNCGSRLAPSQTDAKPYVPSPTLAPDNFICPGDTGLFANPSDCSTFYNCLDGTAFMENCYPGLVFNPEKTLCDYPEKVPACSKNSYNKHIS